MSSEEKGRDVSQRAQSYVAHANAFSGVPMIPSPNNQFTRGDPHAPRSLYVSVSDFRSYPEHGGCGGLYTIFFKFLLQQFISHLSFDSHPHTGEVVLGRSIATRSRCGPLVEERFYLCGATTYIIKPIDGPKILQVTYVMLHCCSSVGAHRRSSSLAGVGFARGPSLLLSPPGNLKKVSASRRVEGKSMWGQRVKNLFFPSFLVAPWQQEVVF